MTKPADPDALARACAEAMLSRDAASQMLAMTLEEARQGYARVAMTLREDMVNGHDIAHGGVVFALADSAFAFACNGYDEVNVAYNCDITFLAPARLGDRLVAECVERARKGRTGLYDVSVRDAAGRPIAEFRGLSRNIGGSVLAPEPKERNGAP